MTERQRRAYGRRGCQRRRRRRNRNRLLLAGGVLLAAAVLLAVFWPKKERRVGAEAEVSATEQPTPSGAVSEPPEPSPSNQAVTQDEWKVVLVNPWNPLPPEHTIETVKLTNGLEVDARCYPDLQDMMDACREDGLSPVICSAYRTREVQERLYQAEVDRWLAQGYGEADAEAKAGEAVALPGTREHQLGLALDIVDLEYQLLDEAQEDTRVQKWLMEHSWEYGFILRYPTGKSDITGIVYEPWHYRYVGKEDAERIHAQGVCLEEYLGQG